MCIRDSGQIEDSKRPGVAARTFIGPAAGSSIRAVAAWPRGARERCSMKREIGEEHVSMLLRSLPPREPPAGLNTSLRVIASRERQRMLEGRGVRRICGSWLDRTRLWSQQLLRPLALPAAGGVFSAVVLFSM